MLTAENLSAFFTALEPLRDEPAGKVPSPLPSATALAGAFEALREPLAREREQGGLINPWTLTGLKRNEVRTAGALAGLWTEDFGGNVSRNFLTAYLARAIPNVRWEDDLRAGYRISTEIRPLGELSERVDLVIETQRHLVGIEIKIDAGLGPEQLERYVTALGTRARLTGRTAHVVLLAPFPSGLKEARSTSWKDVAAAARDAAGRRASERSFVEQFIARFGEHIAAL